MADSGRLICELPVQDVPLFFQVELADHQYDWLKAQWIGGPNGFRVKPARGRIPAAVKLDKSCNPRYSGLWMIEEQENERGLIATEYVICNGAMGCTKHRTFPCQVRLKLEYRSGGACKVFSMAESLKHGDHYKFDPSKLRSTFLLREKIVKMGATAAPGLTSSAIQTMLMLEHPESSDPRVVPPLSVISDTLYRARRQEKTGSPFGDVWTTLKDSPYLAHFSPHWTPDGPEFVILISGEQCYQYFKSVVRGTSGAVGFDAQWKNNKERLPLWILTCQTRTFETIPGLVIVTQDAKKKTLTAALRQCKSILDVAWTAPVMMDKDRAQWQAAKDAGLDCILCEFHVMKAIEPVFKLIHDPERRAQALTCFKRIARAQSRQELNRAIREFDRKTRDLKKFNELIHSRWLSEEWIDGWIDLGRPGDRTGLFNTNNASETWFKQLLRTHLGGRTGYGIAKVLRIITDIVFPKAELQFTQREANIGRRHMNPSERHRIKIEASAKSIRKVCSFAQGSGGFWTISVGKSQHLCRISPPSCDCFEFLWSGRKCAHLAAVELELEHEDSSSSEANLSEEMTQLAISGPVPRARPQRKAKRGPKSLKRFAASKEMIRLQLEAHSSEDLDGSTNEESDDDGNSD